MFRAHGMTLHLHTSGVLLERFVSRVAEAFSRVIVSLDSPDESGYRSIRGVGALQTLERGVARLRSIKPSLPVGARSTLHRLNFRDLPRLVEHAKAMSLDGISFLSADMGSSAFGRTRGGAGVDISLARDEIVEFADVVERTIVEREDDFACGFIAESPDQAEKTAAVLCRARRARPVPGRAVQRTVHVGGDRGGRRGSPLLLSRGGRLCARRAAPLAGGEQPPRVPVGIVRC